MTQATHAPARTRAQIRDRTLRKDRWWRAPAVTALTDLYIMLVASRTVSDLRFFN
jgi:hypothetical protein